MITLRKTINGFLLIQVQIFLKASSTKCWSYYGYKPISYPILSYYHGNSQISVFPMFPPWKPFSMIYTYMAPFS